MNDKLRAFMDVDVPSLNLQVKLLKTEHSSARESAYGLQYPIHQSLTVREAGTIQRLPESVWMMAHKTVAFTQSYVQQARWDSPLLDRMFSVEPWWTLTPEDYSQYADLFSKCDWLSAMQTLSQSYDDMLILVSCQKYAFENQAVLFFLRDSRQFAEKMYDRL
jgi:hypothetical protein